MRVLTPSQQRETAQAVNILTKSDAIAQIVNRPNYVERCTHLTDVIPFVMLHHFWGVTVD